jgi:hypothetical protein
MDLTCSKQFVKSLSQLKKVKKEILCLSSTSLASTCSSASSSTDPQLILPPSPSISAQYKH